MPPELHIGSSRVTLCNEKSHNHIWVKTLSTARCAESGYALSLDLSISNSNCMEQLQYWVGVISLDRTTYIHVPDACILQTLCSTFVAIFLLIVMAVLRNYQFTDITWLLRHRARSFMAYIFMLCSMHISAYLREERDDLCHSFKQ